MDLQWRIWAISVGIPKDKKKLTYPEFIKLFEEPKLPSELLKEYFKNTPKEQVLQDWESTAYLDNTNSQKIRELFEGETCPKCRTKDFENCHSIRCPMRDENLFERGDDYPAKRLQPLFDYLHSEHGLILHESEMEEIIRIVNNLNSNK